MEETKKMITSRKRGDGVCYELEEFVVGEREMDPAVAKWLEENVRSFVNDY